MSILEIGRYFVGEPNLVAIVTDNTLAEITTAGYLTSAPIAADIERLQNGEFQWTLTDVVLIRYLESAGLFLRDDANNSFVALAAPGGLSPTLSSGQFFVGSAGNLASGVAPSGDIASISNAGLVTIANLAITSAKLAAGSVTLAKLAAGITPSHVVKYAGTQANGGGSATITITVTGMLISDLPFVDIASSANAVSVQKVTPTANTITVLLSGDPGAGTVLSYQVLRAAA